MSITSTITLSSTGMPRGWRTGNFHHFITSCSWAFSQVIGPVKGYKTWIRWGRNVMGFAALYPSYELRATSYEFTCRAGERSRAWAIMTVCCGVKT
jgi:hypothetical protein